MLWLWISTCLAADPAALRQLHGDAALAVDLGTQGIGVAADVGPLVGVTVEPGAWAGVSLGTAAVLVGEPTGWGLDGTLAAGAAALLATPGAALTATAAVRGGLRGESLQLTGGLTAPAALALDWPTELALPLDLELIAGGRVGRVWVGARAAAGAGLVPGAPPVLRQGLALWLRLDRP